MFESLESNSSIIRITIEARVVIKHPVHPGTILLEEVLTTLGLGVSDAADRLGIARVTLSRILNGRAGISAQVAIRLEKAGVGKAATWINLQAAYDLSQVRTSDIKGVKPLDA
mgnify:CR=1 FL=1